MLEPVFDITYGATSRLALLPQAAQADALWIGLRHSIDEAFLAAAPRLRMIATPTTGLNHIALDETARRHIEVLSLFGETDFLKDIRATAEHTIGLALSLLRHTALATADAAQGHWERYQFKGGELFGKTAGIVGYGRLGRIVARYFKAFGMRVIACDPYLTADEIETDIEFAPLADLLPQANLVSLHANLHSQNYEFFGAAEFAAMRRGAWFINTARGELVDETALLHSLESNHLNGAALDVISNAPAAISSEHPLIEYARRHRNLLITPHIGGCTRESLEKTQCFLAAKVLRHLEAEIGQD